MSRKEDKVVIDTSDLKKAQAELIAFMEKSIEPELLAAVEKAYKGTDEAEAHKSLDVTFDGTTNA